MGSSNHPSKLCQPKISVPVLLCGCRASPAQGCRVSGKTCSVGALPSLCSGSGFWSRRIPGQGPTCSQGQSRAPELKVLCSALEPLCWEEAWAVGPEGWHWGSGDWISLLQPIIWDLGTPCLVRGTERALPCGVWAGGAGSGPHCGDTSLIGRGWKCKPRQERACPCPERSPAARHRQNLSLLGGARRKN